ncbi:MAG TPA: hypothetical protein VGF21_16720 [Thermoleophilaceae bacterium]|jgi:hypothetical protein
MGIWQRMTGWWRQDGVAKAEEEANMTQPERDVAAEDYESQKDDRSIGGSYIAGGMADYERDSEPPRP